MPTYTFKREECHGDQMELWTDVMTIAEKEKYLEENPDVRQVLVPVAIVGGVEGKTHKVDDGFKENMSRIAEAHPNSPLADRYGSSKSTAQKKVIETAKKHGLVNKINSHVVPKLKSIYKTT